jgi:spore photoproduct lyase
MDGLAQSAVQTRIDGAPVPKLWRPKRVFVTPAALEWEHGQAMVARAEALGCDVVPLKANRLVGLGGEDPRRAYVEAKNTLAIVVAPPTKLRLQPIPPSADWRLDLAEGCPAHCQYCYLAGSLAGPPVTRVYANLDDVLAGIGTHAGRGSVTSGTAARGHEGTTFELSCYTDPLGIEHLTGSLSAAISRVGSGELGHEPSLRFTTKFDAVADLVDLPHGRRTRMRVSVNADEIAGRFEGGTSPMPARLRALRAMAEAGYGVGLTIAPVMPVPEWRTSYGRLLDDVATVTGDLPGLDLTVELITHRFTPASKDVLMQWYPRTQLEMDETQRRQKRSKFGGVKYVYPASTMTEMRSWFTDAVARRLPTAQLLYWT